MMRTVLVLLAVAVLASGCSDTPKPPEGRWQGGYTGDDVMIAARVEVQPDGKVRLSAPNAAADFANATAVAKLDVQTRLAVNLGSGWPKVKAREFDFDGRVFRNPEGVAPQLEWDAKTGHMTMYVYRGSKPTIRVDLEPVKAFAD